VFRVSFPLFSLLFSISIHTPRPVPTSLLFRSDRSNQGQSRWTRAVVPLRLQHYFHPWRVVSTSIRIASIETSDVLNLCHINHCLVGTFWIYSTEVEKCCTTKICQGCYDWRATAETLKGRVVLQVYLAEYTWYSLWCLTRSTNVP